MKKVKRFRYTLLAVCFVAVSLSSCSSDAIDNSKIATRFEPIQFTTDEREAIEAAKPFGLDLFRKYNELSEDENVIISPLSVILDMGMLANGATGETQAEILEALGWSASGIENMNAYARRLMSEYPGMDRTADVKIANGIFNRKDIILMKKDYIEKMKSVYDADSQSYGSDNWENAISSWISDKTNGLIKDMDLGYKDAHLSLINALFFRGIWKIPFEKEKTISDKFTNSDGTVSEVKYMCDRRSMSVYQNELFASVTLNFGNGAYTIDFILPQEELDIDRAVEYLDWNMWTSIHEVPDFFELNLRIPKFDLTHLSDFNETLKVLGINRAFDTYNEFGAMVENSLELSLSSVKQGCSFSIDEEGVTATSSTSANMNVTSPGPMEDGGDFFLDRPFLFTIRENSSGAILFMGKIGKL